MLSITPLKNASAAKSYYEIDNYYSKDSKEAIEQSRWWGRGAEKLGLKGYVHLQDFEQLLEGKLPNGEQLGRRTQKGKKHRPGYDLTFSAPKSVSILAEINNETSLHLAHQNAVAVALHYLETTVVKTRAFRNGEIVFEPVDNVTVAMFRHDTSREMDPTTHTHCVVLNMVERGDGKWRSISSESLFDHKMVTGLIYRSHLAVEVQKLGYEITQTHSDGRFEIVGVPEDAITQFSKRRQQIEDRLEKEGWEGAKASEKVALGTRKSKKESDRSELKVKWLKECVDLNFDPDKVMKAAKNNSVTKPFKLEDPQMVARDAVRYAAAHLGEREAVFQAQDLIREALKHSLGQTTLEHIQQAIHKDSVSGHLISVKEGHWTTLEAIQLEESNIQLMQKGQNQCLEIASLEVVRNFIKEKEKANGHRYTEGQRASLELILTSTDKVIGVQGNAGSGKTTLLKAVREFAENSGYQLIGLATTKNASIELSDKTAIESKTLQKYLVDLEKVAKPTTENEKPLLLIVDEASMVSSGQMHNLLESLGEKTRLILIGDTKQLSAIEAGKPFAQFQKAGMKTAAMSEILRQKSPLLKEAVQDAIKGEVASSFSKITIRQKDNKFERLQMIADEYLGFSAEGREKTFVLIPANEDRVEVNNLIRNGLKKENALKGNEVNTRTLVSRGFSKTYRTRVTNYETNNVVRFNKTYRNLGVKSGEYWQVERIYRGKNEMVLKNLGSDKKITWNPEKVGGRREGATEVYQLEERQLMAGDKIRWLKNQGDQFVNSQTAEILKVVGTEATIKLHNQETVVLNLEKSENQHWDYAFSYTVHAKQGGENTRVIAHMESYRQKLTTQQAFYVTISRAQFEVCLVVDNQNECIKTICKNTGEKLSALEHLLVKDEIDDASNRSESIEKKSAKTKQNNNQQTKHPQGKHWNIDDLQSRLAERVEALAQQLLGEPNTHLSNGKELRFGKKGSLSVPISGKYVGGWRNFESGDKGNLIQLIQNAHQSTFKDALEYAGRFLGISPENSQDSIKSTTIKKVTPKINEPRILDAEDKKSIARAKRLESSSLPIEGSLAERYLREHRGIQGKLSPSFRYHPKVAYYHADKRVEYFPAMLAIAKDTQQKTFATQVVYLDPKTANKADVLIQKRTYGRISLGAAVAINPGQTKVYLAEGPETGLSVAEAYPDGTVLIALSASNFKNVKLSPKQKEVIICMDNDGNNASSQKAVVAAAKNFIEQGHAVYLSIPDTVKDFNDVLKLEGKEAIRVKIDQAIPYVDEQVTPVGEKDVVSNLLEMEHQKTASLTDYYQQEQMIAQQQEKGGDVPYYDFLPESSMSISSKDLEGLNKEILEDLYNSGEFRGTNKSPVIDADFIGEHLI